MRNLFLATAVALGACSLAPLACGAPPPPKAAMNVDPGLWEVTTHPQLSGERPQIPDSMLQRLSPEQQAKMKERMAAMMAKRSEPKKFKKCMTAEKLAKGFSERDEENCKTTVITNTASEFAAHRHCTGQGGKNTDSKIHFKIASRHETQGTVDIAMTQPDGKMTNIHTTMEARWLGADCGGIKDVEIEK